MQKGAKVLGGLLLLAGLVNLILAPIIGDDAFDQLWGVEPIAYIGAVLAILGLTAVALAYAVPDLILRNIV